MTENVDRIFGEDKKFEKLNSLVIRLYNVLILQEPALKKLNDKLDILHNRAFKR